MCVCGYCRHCCWCRSGCRKCFSRVVEYAHYISMYDWGEINLKQVQTCRPCVGMTLACYALTKSAIGTMYTGIYKYDVTSLCSNVLHALPAHTVHNNIVMIFMPPRIILACDFSEPEEKSCYIIIIVRDALEEI